jgi:hypothetical protein
VPLLRLGVQAEAGRMEGLGCVMVDGSNGWVISGGLLTRQGAAAHLLAARQLVILVRLVGSGMHSSACAGLWAGLTWQFSRCTLKNTCFSSHRNVGW